MGALRVMFSGYTLLDSVPSALYDQTGFNAGKQDRKTKQTA